MADDITKAAAALGRRGGKVRSEAKTAAVRANGARANDSRRFILNSPPEGTVGVLAGLGDSARLLTRPTDKRGQTATDEVWYVAQVYENGRGRLRRVHPAAAEAWLARHWH